MSTSSKVVWSEGLFLQPQHFQQQERYFESYVELRCRSLVSNSWGFTDLEVEPGGLRIGKFGLRRAAGVFPDGTPMRMPEDDPLPLPLDITTDARDQIVYLAVPGRSAGAPEVGRSAGTEALVRHGVNEVQAADATSSGGGVATLEVGALRTRLLLAADVTPAYACIPVAHLVERRADGQVVLDDDFIPTVLEAKASIRLASYTKKLRGQMHQRGEKLASLITATGRGGSSEVANFLMLQAINRYQPLVEHFAEARVHPEDLFRFCVAAAGELSTFTTASKRPPALPLYRHDHLRESFDPVVAELERSLNTIIDEAAIQIPMEERRYGLWLARVHDASLLSTGNFVLAMHAEVPGEELRRRVPAQLKVGPPDRIQEIVTRQLRAVPVFAMPMAPRELPVHAGFVYFEFDQSHELWKECKAAGSVAMFPGGDLPGLTMELWAIRTIGR